MYFPLFKVVILVVGVMSAYLVRSYLVNPKLLNPSCLNHSDRCVRLEYFRKQNTVLVYVYPSNWILWFNGDKFFVYQVGNTGRECNNPDYQPAFEIRPRRRKVEEYTCIRKVKSVEEFYEDVEKKYAYINLTDPSAFSAFDLAEYLVREQILTLPAGS
jgi:hypothetical protein